MSVTEQDRKRAVVLLRAAARDDLIHPTVPFAQPLMVDRLAQALADERERARAPFLALADEYGRVANDYFAAGHRDKGYDALEHAAEIRRAAEENQ